MTKITQNPAIRNGQPRINGTRLTVKDVVENIESGMTAKEIIADFPSLTVMDVLAAIKYNEDYKQIKSEFRDKHAAIFKAVSEAIHYMQAVEEAAENDQNPALTDEEEKELRFYNSLFNQLRESTFHVEINDLDAREATESIVATKLRELQKLRKEKNVNLEDLAEEIGVAYTTVRRHFAGSKMSISDYYLYQTILERK